jgi:hypothetical protein
MYRGPFAFLAFLARNVFFGEGTATYQGPFAFLAFLARNSGFSFSAFQLFSISAFQRYTTGDSRTTRFPQFVAVGFGFDELGMGGF